MVFLYNKILWISSARKGGLLFHVVSEDVLGWCSKCIITYFVISLCSKMLQKWIFTQDFGRPTLAIILLYEYDTYESDNGLHHYCDCYD